MAKKKDEEIPLFRVFNNDTGRWAYLPSGSGGQALEEAERLSESLVASTEVYPTFVPEGDEDRGM